MKKIYTFELTNSLSFSCPKLSTEVAEGTNNNVEPQKPLLNSRKPEQPSFKVPVLVLRQNNGGTTDYAWQWIEWQGFEQFRPQIEPVISNFRPFTSQWSQMMDRIPGWSEFAAQYNQLGNQASGAFNPSTIMSNFQTPWGR